MGVSPVATTAAAVPARRHGRLFVEIVLAFAVFAGVAYCIQDPDLLWRAWEHPLRWLDFAAHARIAE